MTGMMMSLTIELITAPNAAPMTTATARSTMFPLKAKALNSCQSLSFIGHLRYTIDLSSNRSRSPAFLFFVPVLFFHEAGLFGFNHGAAGHTHRRETTTAHEAFHQLELAEHVHPADGAHHVAGHLELLHELADLVKLDAGAAGDAAAARAVEKIGVLAFGAGHRIVDGAHVSHLLLD